MRSTTILCTLTLTAAVLAAPAKVSVSGRQADLPTNEITSVIGKVTGVVPVDAVKDSLPLGLPVPVKRQLGAVTGLGGAAGAFPIDTVKDAVPVNLPIPLGKRQLGNPTGEVTGIVGTVTGAVPLDTVKGAIPADLPLPVRRAIISSALAPLTNTLTLLVSKFTTVSQALASASTQLNSMLPANIEIADAGLDQITALLATAQSEFHSAISSVQGGDVSGLLTKAASAGSSDTVSQLTALLATGEKMLAQLAKDADAIAGLGATNYLAKLESIKSTAVQLLAEFKSASALPLPL